MAYEDDPNAQAAALKIKFGGAGKSKERPPERPAERRPVADQALRALEEEYVGIPAAMELLERLRSLARSTGEQGEIASAPSLADRAEAATIEPDDEEETDAGPATDAEDDEPPLEDDEEAVIFEPANAADFRDDGDDAPGSASQKPQVSEQEVPPRARTEAPPARRSLSPPSSSALETPPEGSRNVAADLLRAALGDTTRAAHQIRRATRYDYLIGHELDVAGTLGLGVNETGITAANPVAIWLALDDAGACVSWFCAMRATDIEGYDHSDELLIAYGRVTTPGAVDTTQMDVLSLNRASVAAKGVDAFEIAFVGATRLNVRGPSVGVSYLQDPAAFLSSVIDIEPGATVNRRYFPFSFQSEEIGLT